MEFRQLHLFIAVAEELHFGRAAARVGMAQPPFSQQIRRLEAELGVELLTRTSRRVALTGAGARLLHDARDLFARRAAAVSTVRQTAEGRLGSLRIGFAASAASGLLPEILRRYGAAWPGVDLHLVEREVAEAAAALLAGELDVALMRGPFQHPGLAAEVVLREPFMLVLAGTHPRAGEDRIALSSLAGEPFILFPRSAAPGLYDTITSMCVGAGFSPDVRQIAASWPSIAALVGSGLGLSIAPRSAAALHPREVVLRELTDANGHAELALAWPEGPLSPTVEAFLGIVRDVLPRPLPTP
jgi:DNA-binding transcriptional LysR family regulator